MPRAFCILGVTANVIIGVLLILQTAKSGLLARWTAPSTSAQRSFVNGMSGVSLVLNPVLALLLLRAPAATLPGVLLVGGLMALLGMDAIGAYAYRNIASDADLDARVAAGLQGPYLYILASFVALLIIRAIVYAVIFLP